MDGFRGSRVRETRLPGVTPLLRNFRIRAISRLRSVSGGGV